jgi:acetyl-CoA carboxylase carboxyl transferase subunit beta
MVAIPRTVPREPALPLASSAVRLPSTPRRLPVGLWVRCPSAACRQLLYVREHERNLNVCPRCGHHSRLSAGERIAQLVDEGSFHEHDADHETTDPLGFVSLGQSYRERVRQIQRETRLRDAIVCGSGRIGAVPVELAVLDFTFLGGSMGSVVGEKLVRTLNRARARRCPAITVSCSGGARMHEGLLSLVQMARTAAAVAKLHQARLPLLSVLTDPTTGGVTASFAGLGDVLIAEPGALIGFAGPRVIEQITRQKLPPQAQRAELLLERGMLDMVVPRRELRACLTRLLRLYRTSWYSTDGGANGGSDDSG